MPAEERAELILKNDLLREVCLDLPEIILESQTQTEIQKDDNRQLDEEKLADRIKRRLEETEAEIKLLTEDFEPEKDEIVKKNGKNQESEMNEKNEAFILQETAEKITENIIKTINRSGFELFELSCDPFVVEKVYYFQELKLYGAPPKVLEMTGKLMPYLIKISKAPDNGVWEGERIAAAAYLMILEREFGRQFVSDSALIDYFGDYRLIQVRALDRKKVFRAIRKIKDIKSGKMPREKNIRLCEKCVFQEKCQIKGKTIFTKLFGERTN